MGPRGYEVRKRFRGGTPITADLLADQARRPVGQQEERSRAIAAPVAVDSAVLDDGRYHYEAVLVDAAGQSRVVSGLFYVELGVAISREAMRGRLSAVRSELREGERATRGSELQRVTGQGLNRIIAPAVVNNGVFIEDTANDGHTYLNLESQDNPPDDSDWVFNNTYGVLEIQEVPGDAFGIFRARMLPGGNLGLGTTVPGQPLHIVGANPLRLSAGADQAEFNIGPSGLWIQDDEGESILKLNHSAPESRLAVTGTGVGIDTETPGGNLHIFGFAGSDVFNAVGPDPSISGNALNFGYSGFTFGSGSGFFNVRPGGATAINPALYFATGNIDRMLIDNQGFLGVHLDGTLGPGFNPSHPIHSQTTGAHLSAAGIWTNASSREHKRGIRHLGVKEAQAALTRLEPIGYRSAADGGGEEHLGFIAEDVPALVATSDRTGLSPMDIVAVLTRVVQEQQQTIEALLARVEELERAF